jgi:hypothetical protein
MYVTPHDSHAMRPTAMIGNRKVAPIAYSPSPQRRFRTRSEADGLLRDVGPTRHRVTISAAGLTAQALLPARRQIGE